MELSPATYIIAAAVILVLALLLFLKPMRRMFKFLLNALSGVLALVALNLFGGVVGVVLGVNLWTFLTALVLGLPGVALLLFLKLAFGA